ncbi:MAG: hypothetical protein ACKO9I_07310 [Sphaerospermopsis kisseleviana]|uniref:hypothetical protein n=1 Tax=Sphaerospermopsis sp. LEGE 00249 TaxID=1380707 RepID=UPI00164D0390|nr:hypothetical protein [Sphaerospermopsis sp. LEGE 00249]MBC5797248.1 hypothetical protein [Sphaerospermopsis sp. LEGE 00249]
MTNTKQVRRRQPGRIFPEFTIPPEELAKREAERNARGEKARVVFNRVRPELINDHYNWFMVIEPNSGDYFIDVEESGSEKKAREKYPQGWLVTFRINETGACGRI